MEDRDTKGDLYEYMLGKIATAGQNGQFRTPRHIIRLMVEMTAPTPDRHHLRPGLRHGRLPGRRRRVPARAPPGAPARREAAASTSTTRMFHGFDFDNTMLRIGSMNMLLHGVENPDIRYRDSLAQDHAGEEESYTLVLANPPFAGSPRLREHAPRTCCRSSRPRRPSCSSSPSSCACSSPAAAPRSSCPTACSSAPARRTRTLRRMLVEEQKLDAVISLPGGVFKPYAGVSTAILLFTKTNSGGTDHVWFYDVRGRRLEPRRQAHAAAARGQARPRARRPRSPPRSTPRTTCPTCWRAGQQRDGSRARAPAHRAELLRAQGRHRRAGLRPLASTATRKSCTRRSSTARRRRSSPTSASWRRRSSRG